MIETRVAKFVPAEDNLEELTKIMSGVADIVIYIEGVPPRHVNSLKAELVKHIKRVHKNDLFRCIEECDDRIERLQVLPSMLQQVAKLMLRYSDAKDFNIYAENCITMVDQNDLVKLRDL